MFFFSRLSRSTKTQPQSKTSTWYSTAAEQLQSESMVYGNGTGVFQAWNSIRSLFTIDLLCSQNVSLDWWNRRTFLCSSNRIPLMAEHGSVSAAYTHMHLIWRPWSIISSILSSAIPTAVSFLWSCTAYVWVASSTNCGQRNPCNTWYWFKVLKEFRPNPSRWPLYWDFAVVDHILERKLNFIWQNHRHTFLSSTFSHVHYSPWYRFY